MLHTGIAIWLYRKYLKPSGHKKMPRYPPDKSVGNRAFFTMPNLYPSYKGLISCFISPWDTTPAGVRL